MSRNTFAYGSDSNRADTVIAVVPFSEQKSFGRSMPVLSVVVTWLAPLDEVVKFASKDAVIFGTALAPENVTTGSGDDGMNELAQSIITPTTSSSRFVTDSSTLRSRPTIIVQ